MSKEISSGIWLKSLVPKKENERGLVKACHVLKRGRFECVGTFLISSGIFLFQNIRLYLGRQCRDQWTNILN